MLLKTAVQAMQDTEPDGSQIDSSSKRVAERLGIDNMGEIRIDNIASCEDVRDLFGPYRAGVLSPARALLIEDHMRDCFACRREFRGRSGAAVLDWSTPKARRGINWHARGLGWALAASVALIATSAFIYRAYWQVPPGVRAEVQSIDGSAYRISDAGDRPLSAGDALAEGDHLRTSGGAHAVLRLSDGSTVEVNERTVVGVGARGRNMTLSLDNGAVIVQAAKRTSGHLYVKTPDCRVAVTGTVFSVNSGIKGSRVAVLQGTVHVSHAGIDSLVAAGNQVSTNDNLTSEPVAEQISWSHDRDKYLVLLAQFATLRQQIEKIPFPQPRYSSDLLERVPADTLLYISIPNLGDFMNEANQTFHDQLKQSPALQEWWNSGHGNNSADLDSLVEKLHQASQYLGEEVVVVGVKQAQNPGFAIIADVKQGGLDDFIKKQFPTGKAMRGITMLDQKSLRDARVSSKGNMGAYALVREHEAIFSNNIATLSQVNAQLDSAASGFANGAFGQQITAAYSRGAGIILAADLHQMLANKNIGLHPGDRASEAMENSGMDGVSYLIAEHREVNGQPENRVNLQFSGTRKGIASWLAAPAPIGSLDFVTPNAAVAVAILSKDPKAIADDLIAMAVPNKDSQKNGLNEAEEKLQINVREDLAANLGGDFLLALDGPVLPTPSWKAVIEVNDSERLEQTLEKLTQSIRNQTSGNAAHSISIQSSNVGGQQYYSVFDSVTGTTVAQYTFANGYMIVAPSRALLIESMHTYATGNSLANSTAFKALLPKDENENYSAIAYQNLGPVLTPLLSELSGETADAVRKLAADARPTAICARGEESRIEAASDSRLFGFDFLTLGTLLHSGNKHAGASVIE